MRRVWILALAGCAPTTVPVHADVHLDIQADRYGTDVTSLFFDADIGPHAIERSLHSSEASWSWCRERPEGACVVRTCDSHRPGGEGESTPRPPPIAPPLRAETVAVDWALGPSVVLEATEHGSYTGGRFAGDGGDGEVVPDPGVPLHFTMGGGEVLDTDALVPWPGVPAMSATVAQRGDTIELSWVPPPIAVDRMEVMLSDVGLFGGGTSVVCIVEPGLGRVVFAASLASSIRRAEAWIGANVRRDEELALDEGTRLIAHVSTGVVWLHPEW